MRLPVDRALLVLHLLTEGCSVRAIERITGTEKRTIRQLLVQVGEGCERLTPTASSDLSGTPSSSWPGTWAGGTAGTRTTPWRS
jgi:hypothetical protein